MRRCRRSWPIGSRSSGCSSTSSPTRSNPWARHGAGLAALRSARCRWTARTCCSKVSDTGTGIAPEEMRAHLRCLLHDQGDRHRPGPVALPHHRRRAWRASLGLARRGTWRDLSTCNCRAQRYCPHSRKFLPDMGSSILCFAMSAMGGSRTLAPGRKNPQLDNPDIFRWLAGDSGPPNL